MLFESDDHSILGDGALTPAISVLSAVEGIGTTSAALIPWILPISVILILFLFVIQMFGTSKIGTRTRMNEDISIAFSRNLGLFFAPIMIVWFITICILGVWRITFEPSILHAFNPWQAISYLIREKQRGFLQLGKLVLRSVTMNYP